MAVAQYYHLFEIFGQPPLPYSNLIAFRRETIELVGNDLTSYDFDSQMGRKLMVCQVKLKETGTIFHVLNAHLESLSGNWKYRKDQMESIYRLIKGEKINNFILTGDFNICHDHEPIETQIRLYGWSDAWREMGSPQSIKYTYDSLNNPHAFKKGEPKYQSRLDRILYKFKDDQIVITKFKFLGYKEPFISDHYGILSEFMIKA